MRPWATLAPATGPTTADTIVQTHGMAAEAASAARPKREAPPVKGGDGTAQFGYTSSEYLGEETVDYLEKVSKAYAGVWPPFA